MTLEINRKNKLHGENNTSFESSWPKRCRELCQIVYALQHEMQLNGTFDGNIYEVSKN